MKKSKQNQGPSQKENRKHNKNEYPHADDSSATTSAPPQDDRVQYRRTWLCMYEEIKKEKKTNQKPRTNLRPLNRKSAISDPTADRSRERTEVFL